MPWTARGRRAIAIEIAEALHSAHPQGVVHRDLMARMRLDF